MLRYISALEEIKVQKYKLHVHVHLPSYVYVHSSADLSKVQVPNKMTETAGLFFYTGTEYDNACSLATSSPKNYKEKIQ